MKLDKATQLEVVEFIKNLTPSELGDYDIANDDIAHTAVYLKKYYRDGKLIAIGGISRWYRMFHHFFFMVKTDYQSQGIGSEISYLSMKWAKETGVPYMLGAAKMSSIRSMKIIGKLGYQRLWDNGSVYYSMVILNKRYTFLKYVLKVVIPIYHSPIGKPIKKLKEIGVFMFTNELEKGEYLKELVIKITPEYSNQILNSIHCDNPIYQTIIHPALLIGLSNITKSPSFSLEDNVAAIHVQDEIEFKKASKVGDTLVIYWRVMDIFHRRDKRWRDIEYQIVHAMIINDKCEGILERRMTDYFTRGKEC